MKENDTPQFGLFDEDAELDVQSRYLPHWFQPDVAVFITFRTADSLPREVLTRWENELREWLTRAGFPLASGEPLPDLKTLTHHSRYEYRKQRDRLWHWHLDACHGECWLRRRELAEIVMASLLHFNGERYDLASAIIMPNHVHLIAQFHPPTTCRGQCESWLHYSARQINKRIGRKGAFWQSEPFDHLIRSEEQFHYLLRYIAENGTKAGLSEQEYLHWTCFG